MQLSFAQLLEWVRVFEPLSEEHLIGHELRAVQCFNELTL
jgi:hypothetical protein